MIKKTLKYFFRGILLFSCGVGLYLFSAYLCQFITTNDDYKKPKNGIEVFLISNGVHTDICLPLTNNDTFWNNYFNPEEFKDLIHQPKYISFGWGDKGFYLDTPTWDDLTAKTALKAALLPSATALHVTYRVNKPQLSENIRSFSINKSSLKKIKQYIVSHIKLKKKRSILIDCCRYPGVYDNFYEAKGSYHVFKTCNVWTNNAIKTAGVKTSIWTPFSSAILYQFENK
jgi:uncharacterized protein (TIGR02117 family)